MLKRSCIFQKMGKTDIEEVTKLYKKLAQVPALLKARLNNQETVVESWWSQRNIEKGTTTKFTKSIVIAPGKDYSKIAESLPLDVTNEVLTSVSPSENLKAVLKDGDDKQFLEIWNNTRMIRCVDLTALDVHGKVYADGEFKSFTWSPDETKLLYVAEKKVPKSEPFYKRKAPPSKKDDGEVPPAPVGEEYVYRQDWGEQLVGKKQSILAEYCLDEDQVKILEGIPEDICPAQPIYAPDGKSIIGIAYDALPRKLGLIYCSNRECRIFKLDFDGNYTEITGSGKSVKNPIFTPSGTTLLWLERDSLGPHHGCMVLVKTTTPLVKDAPKTTVLDIVPDFTLTSNSTKFYGLYNTAFIERCWASDDRLIVSTNQRNTINSYMIDISTGVVTEFEYPDGSLIVLDVKNDTILASLRNFLVPDVLAIGKVPPKGIESKISWTKLTEDKPLKELENCTYKYMTLTQNDDAKVKEFTAIYIGPKSGATKTVPLIVWPHGGPHSAFTNNMALSTSLILSLGYASILINFRGSTGSGENTVQYLLGKVGTADVSDCVLATKQALKDFPWLNPDKLVLTGGSHGGFLVTHLSGQYPDMFKAVVARNPVIDIASMSITSDIPDWCYAEGGKDYSQQGEVDDDLLMHMRKMSPIVHAHKVKAPTLLQIGSKDLRVPPQQGVDYYYRLKTNGIPVKMNMYDDNHPLGTVPNEMDNQINGILWIKEHLQ